MPGKQVAKETHLLGEYLETLSSEQLAEFNTAQKVWPIEEISEHVGRRGTVWLGPTFAAWPPFLVKHGITHVVCLTQDPSPARTYGSVKNLHLPIDDEPDSDMLSQLAGAVAWISEAVASGGQVLVHCRAGRSRSATVVAAFVAQSTACSAEAALDCCVAARPFVQLNEGFATQLRTFVALLEASSSVKAAALSSSSMSTEADAQLPGVCDLCKLEKVTPWFEETDELTVLLCDQCDNPMVVWRRHTMLLSRRERETMSAALSKHADKAMGAGDWYMDTKQRTVYTHLHWHARPHNDLTRLMESMRKKKAAESNTSSRL